MSNNIIDKIQLSGVTYDIGGQGGSGVSVVEVTQAEYDALPTSAKTDTSKMYVITDAEAGDLTNYYTKTETNTLLGGKADTATTYTKTEVDNAITAATATKQDTLVSGTNIKTINNQSLLGSGNIDIQGGGGGKAIEAGRGISITTGETADTVSFDLPISAGTGNRSILMNQANVASGQNSVAFGSFTYAFGPHSLAGGHITTADTSSYYGAVFGKDNIVRNENEFACGRGNISTYDNDAGSSGRTTFSVGNGANKTYPHNALEVRDNGDIYIADTNNTSTSKYYEKPMIKLQDALGGGGGSITIDPTLDSGSTNPVANSAITNTVGKYYYAYKFNDSLYSTPWGSISSNGCVGTTLAFKNIITDAEVSCPLWLSKINGKKIFYPDYSAPNESYFNLNLVETSAITTSVTSSSTDAQVPSAKAVNDKLGGLSLVKLTQAQYDALATKDNNTLYVVTDS